MAVSELNCITTFQVTRSCEGKTIASGGMKPRTAKAIVFLSLISPLKPSGNVRFSTGGLFLYPPAYSFSLNTVAQPQHTMRPSWASDLDPAGPSVCSTK